MKGESFSSTCSHSPEVTTRNSSVDHLPDLSLEIHNDHMVFSFKKKTHIIHIALQLASSLRISWTYLPIRMCIQTAVKFMPLISNWWTVRLFPFFWLYKIQQGTSSSRVHHSKRGNLRVRGWGGHRLHRHCSGSDRVRWPALLRWLLSGSNVSPWKYPAHTLPKEAGVCPGDSHLEEETTGQAVGRMERAQMPLAPLSHHFL